MSRTKKLVAVKLDQAMHADVSRAARAMHSSVSAVIRMSIERQLVELRPMISKATQRP